MRRIACSVMILTFFIAVGSAWAEPARGSRRDRAESARMLRADERSRAITRQICRGCGVERHAHQRRHPPKMALRRGRSRVPVTTAWTPIPALPLR
jgi:hypothetical protein